MARVLVIDDDRAVRSVLSRMLRRAGHEVLEAADGVTGAHMLRSQPVDLALVDIYMPGHGGLATIPELRKDRPALKIIAISGADESGPMRIATRAKASGADAFLKKPFEGSELLAVIGTTLSKPSTSVPRDITQSRTLLEHAGYSEWSDRELFYHCGQRVIFTRECVDHADDIWVAERIAEGNPTLAWRLHADRPLSPDVLRAVEERCGQG